MIIPSNVSAAPKFWQAGFNGSSYLATSSGPGSLNSDNFTVEMWAKPIAYATSYPTLWSNYNSWGSGSFAISAGYPSGAYGTSIAGSGGVISSTTDFAYGTWAHVAVVRNGSTFTLFTNGTSRGTYTSNGYLTVNGQSWFGATGEQNGITYFNGFISDFRLTMTNIYSSNFTPPPRGSLTAIANTRLLTLKSSTLTDLSGNGYSVYTAGGTVTLSEG